MLCFRIVISVHITVHCYSYTLLSSHYVLLLKLTSQFNCSSYIHASSTNYELSVYLRGKKVL